MVSQTTHAIDLEGDIHVVGLRTPPSVVFSTAALRVVKEKGAEYQVSTKAVFS